jgi:outer membrane protein TolC
MKRSEITRILFPLLVLAVSAGVTASPGNSSPGNFVHNEPRAIRLDESAAVERALKENLSLRAQQTTIATQARNADLWWNRLVPSFSVGSSLIRHNEEITPPPTAAPYSLSFALDLEARMTLTPGVAADVRSERDELEAAQSRYTDAGRSIERQVRRLFYSLLLDFERIQVAEFTRDLARETLEQTATDFRLGRVDSRTLRQAELGTQQAELRLRETRSQYEDSLAVFKNLVGIEEEAPLLLEGELPGEDFFRTMKSPEYAPDLRPDISAMDAELRAQGERITSMERGRSFPALGVAASWTPRTGDPFNPGNEGIYGEWNDTGGVSLSLRFELQELFPFSRSGTSLNTAEARLESLRLQKQDAVEAGLREYHSLLRRIDTRIAALDSRRMNLNLAREIYDLTDQAYRAGTTDLLTLRSARSEVEAARLDLLQETFNIKSDLIDLEYVSGVGGATDDRKGIMR